MTDASRLAVLARLTCRVWDHPSSNARRIAILLHGRGGDENSMAVFRTVLPADTQVVSPRAPVTDSPGGFAWIPRQPDSSWPVHSDFANASASLVALADALASTSGAADSILMIGFSQGGAAAAAFALEHRSRIVALVLLAGFVAEPPAPLLDGSPLRGLPVFVAFGTEDDLIPAPIAQRSIAALRRAGSSLTICDSSVGHKVSAACLRSLGEWEARERNMAKHEVRVSGKGVA